MFHLPGVKEFTVTKEYALDKLQKANFEINKTE